MVSTTSAYSPVKNFNSHMENQTVGQMKNSTFTAIGGVHRNAADVILMQNDNFRTTKNVVPENQLPVKTVAGIEAERVFGFDHYEVPAVDHKWNTTGFSSCKYVEKCFTDQKAKAFQWVPPSKYVAHDDWKVLQNKGSDKRGKFGKYKKETFTEEVFKYEKSRPSPHAYPTFKLKEKYVHGNYKQNDTTINFTLEHKWQAAQTPSANYDNRYGLVRRALFEKKIYPAKEPPSWRIAKEDGPAPGLYDVIKCEADTQKRRTQGPPKRDQLRVIFTDTEAKRRKYVPGMGHYKELDKGLNAISKRPGDMPNRH